MMRKKGIKSGAIVLVFLLLLTAGPGLAQEPEGEPKVPAGFGLEDSVASKFSYQGVLQEDDELVSGSRDMVFRLYADDACATQVGADIAKPGVPVTEGLFDVQLEVDPDGFCGQGLWLEVEVAGAAIACQEIQPVPYALSLRPGAVISGTATALTLGSSSDEGIRVESAGTDGIRIASAGESGVHIDSVQAYGLYVLDAGHNGVNVEYAGENGLQVHSAHADGVHIISALDNGVFIGSALDHGVYVATAERDGLHVDFAVDDGVHIDSAFNRGVFVADAQHHGLDVYSAGEDGLHVTNAGHDGIHVQFPTEDGLHVVDAGLDGVFVESAGEYGIHVADATNYGLVVDASGNDGLYVGLAGADGVQVQNANNHGLYVLTSGNDGVNVWTADDDGFYVENAVDDGFVVQNAGDIGLVIQNATGYGIYVANNGTEGVVVENSGWDGVYVSSAVNKGVYANTTNANQEWGLYTPDKIWAGASLASGGPLMLVAQSGDASALEPGELVVAAGLGQPFGGSPSPVALVRRADAAGSQPVAGVVYRRFLAEETVRQHEQEGEVRSYTEVNTHTADGTIAPGEYLLLCILGPCQVKADAAQGAVRPGDALAVSNTRGCAAAAKLLTLDGVSFYPPGATFGTALEPLDEGTGLIHVLLTTR
jgi:hypothetical protein